MADPEFTTDELAAEQWRSVPGYEGYYSVSDLGRVRRDKAWNGTQAGRILTPNIDKRHTYKKLTLSKGHKSHTVRIHHIVMTAFVGPRPPGMQVNHKDTIKTNNRLTNLEYVTPLENTRHAHAAGLGSRGARHGELVRAGMARHVHYMHRSPELIQRGSNHPNAKLDEQKVREMRRMFDAGAGLDEVAALFNIKRGTAECVKYRRSWKHVH